MLAPILWPRGHRRSVDRHLQHAETVGRPLPPADYARETAAAAAGGLRSEEIALSGCENRVWLGHQLQEDGTLHFYGDSEGRIVRGLLAVLLTEVEGKTPQQIAALDPLALFDRGIARAAERHPRQRLAALAAAVKAIAARYA